MQMFLKVKTTTVIDFNFKKFICLQMVAKDLPSRYFKTETLILIETLLDKPLHPLEYLTSV